MRKAATCIALGVVLVLAAPFARADPPTTDASTPDPARYGYRCGTLPPADQPPCRRCVDEAGAYTSTAASNALQHDDVLFNVAFFKCQTRMKSVMKSERAERQALLDKFNAWQPRGYEGTTGDGIEALADAELDALPATESAALARINEISVDLGGKDVMPADKVAEALAEMRGFIAKERACRADGKCMAARAARKAAEEFFTSVVSPMCEADKSREAAEAGIAKERANPSGVVDLNVLHSLGAEVQDAKEQIKSLAPAYANFAATRGPGGARSVRSDASERLDAWKRGSGTLKR